MPQKTKTEQTTKSSALLITDTARNIYTFFLKKKSAAHFSASPFPSPSRSSPPFSAPLSPCSSPRPLLPWCCSTRSSALPSLALSPSPAPFSTPSPCRSPSLAPVSTPSHAPSPSRSTPSPCGIPSPCPCSCSSPCSSLSRGFSPCTSRGCVSNGSCTCFGS